MAARLSPAGVSAFATLDEAARLLRAGDLGAAERTCKALLKRRPRDAQALHVMALAVHHGGRPGDAVPLFKKAAKYAGGDPVIHCNLGECYRALGKPGAAIASYRQALSLQPGDANAQAGIGEARLAQGRPADAEASFRAATDGQPGLVTAWNGLGIALREQGRLSDAVECWRRALAIDPTLAVVCNNLGLGLHSLGRIDEATEALLRALELQPDSVAIRRNFAGCLKNRPVTTVTPGLRRQIEACIAAGDIDAQTLVPAALDALEADPVFARTLEAATESAADLADTLPSGLWRDSLFLRLLETTFLARPQWERLLTRLRAAVLVQPDTAPVEAIVAIALQCFNNEYVFAVEEVEQAALVPLRRNVEARLAAEPAPSPALERDLARLAMYLPLHALDRGDKLLAPPADAWSTPVRRLLQRQLREPAEERKIRASMRSMAATDNQVSTAVREMYEENPYPRWMSTAGRSPQPADTVLRGHFPHFRAPGFLRNPLSVLIAGCGTGKQAIDVATRYEGCRVLAVDLSLSSLSYAQRMARALGVDNIDFLQADILGLDDLEDRFHLIECSGVLMAIEDPLAAWRLLVGLLRPEGLMKIGLYSEIARRHVVAARAFIAERGYPATVEGIRRCRQDIAALPVGRIERKVMENRDFYSTSSCRDLIFHVQEHRFTLPRISGMLETLGLRFIGFELNKPEAINAYRAAFPGDDEMTDLDNWDEFEKSAPDIFIAMYQFWCQKV